MKKLKTYLVLPFNDVVNGLYDKGFMDGISSDKKISKQNINNILERMHEFPHTLDDIIYLIGSLNKDISIQDELEYIFLKFNKYVPYSYIGVALVKDGGETLEGEYAIGDKSILETLNNGNGTQKRYKISSTSLGNVIKRGTPRIINDLEKYVERKESKPYNEAILSAGIRSSIALPMIVNSKAIGVIFFSSIYKNVYNNEHVKFLNIIAKSIAISFNKNMFVDNLMYSSILALAKLAEARDEDTGEHIERMKAYSKLIAKLLYNKSSYKAQLSLAFIDQIEKFSPMHDIGKVGVRDSILLKPGKLTEEEYEEMKKHTIFGGRVLRAAEENILKSGKSMFSMGIEIAEDHHEKWDGTGYPNGKSGQDIPLSARIVAVADVFDALTSKRSYKEPFSFEESFDFILKMSGKQFDPEIINIFEENRDKIYSMYSSFHTKNASH
ncbi:HD-GYP domain-containing protein [Clostridium oryzae]|nr:HD domain-containing phosphohydrolase [Clostridium oryzae]